MNHKSNLSRIVTIVCCAILIITVFFARNFTKDSKEKDMTEEPMITQEGEEQNVEEENVEAEKEDPNKPTDPALQEYLEEDQLENIDDSLYQEDAGDTYQRK